MERIHHKISNLVHSTSATLISINEMMNMLNASMTECCWFPLCMMNARLMYDVSAVPDRCLHLCMINNHVSTL